MAVKSAVSPLKKAAPKKVAAKKTATKKAAAKKPSVETPEVDARFANFKLIVKPSEIHRWGVFAGEPIPIRRKIIEYTGERLNRKQVQERSNHKLVYLFTLDKYWTLDGAVNGSGAQFVNHCCDPNVSARVMKGHILYFAKRDIKKGEELTLDYHFGKDVAKIRCYCGAESCRGTINVYA